MHSILRLYQHSTCHVSLLHPDAQVMLNELMGEDATEILNAGGVGFLAVSLKCTISIGSRL